ncbi:MAG: hypothetical protein PQJ46_06190 [Spirochaetales bacterium]|nr:hypothetical protein [Spirochaetales bacterium]
MKECNVFRVNQIRLSQIATDDEAKDYAVKKLGIEPKFIKDVKISRRSIDARKGNVSLVFSVDITVQTKNTIKLNKSNIEKIEKTYYKFPVQGNGEEIVVAGAGPAGLFASIILAENGFKPLLIERGERVDNRKKTVEKFWQTGLLNPESNMQFGEGGAGTFSDGKLNSGIKDKSGRIKKVLETFVKFGAPDSILIDAKPHIGTDFLEIAVAGIRNQIIKLGGEVRFNTKLTSVLANPELKAITVNENDTINTEQLILALGHSARDTITMLHSSGLEMSPKVFSVGLRIEHLQDTINQAQYGERYSSNLPVADYKLSYHTKSGRGVYTFCMCPGGYVVNSASEEGMCVTNGMSYYDRAGVNANSAVLVNIYPKDFDGNDILAGIEFQRKLEREAFSLGGADYSLPVQRFEDFAKEQPSKSFGIIQPQIKGRYKMADLASLFPLDIKDSLIEGINEFGKRIEGFNSPDAVLTGVESRSSSPVRINRDDMGESNISGIFPCGEGSGFAGGIISAAVDGIKAAEKAALAVKKVLR